MPDASAVAAQPSSAPLPYAAIVTHSMADYKQGRITTYLVVLYTRHTVLRDRSPLPVRANPEFGVNLVLGNDLAR